MTAADAHAIIGEPSLELGVIHIIESLTTGRTGYRLFEDLEPFALSLQPSIAVRYWHPLTADEFKTTLTRIADDASSEANAPALHIECHGSVDGIQMASDEFLAWAEFRDELIAINRATRMNLLVVLAACKGVWLLQNIRPVDRAPFATLIGPNRIVTTGELERACPVFFKTLLRNRDVGIALREMNGSIGSGPNETFVPVTSQEAFRGVFAHYLETESSDEAIDRRVQAILGTVDQSKMSHFERAIREGNLRRRLRDHAYYFNQFRVKFFFIDEFPENGERFRITFDDCVLPRADDSVKNGTAS